MLGQRRTATESKLRYYEPNGSWILLTHPASSGSRGCMRQQKRCKQTATAVPNIECDEHRSLLVAILNIAKGNKCTGNSVTRRLVLLIDCEALDFCSKESRPKRGERNGHLGGNAVRAVPHQLMVLVLSGCHDDDAGDRDHRNADVRELLPLFHLSCTNATSPNTKGLDIEYQSSLMQEDYNTSGCACWPHPKPAPGCDRSSDATARRGSCPWPASSDAKETSSWRQRACSGATEQ
eukprot:3130881-Pleurochrysis_carterae.AAC.6